MYDILKDKDKSRVLKKFAKILTYKIIISLS